MKTKTQRRHVERNIAALVTIGVLGLATVRGFAAPGTEAPPARAGQRSDLTSLRVLRASDFIGTDVLSSRGEKLGDIVDYAFDTRAPRLEYVIIMTGGFLDIGGELRAVPAEALTVDGDTARLDITRDAFKAIPKISGKRTEFLSAPENVAAIDRAFGRQHAEENTGRGALVTYSGLQRRDAYSTESGRVGYIDDVWINLDRDRAPFIEITPMINPFQLPGDTRYAIPMARLQPQSGDNLTFDVSADELRGALPVSDAPGVQMVNDGFIGNKVLRVTVGRVPRDNVASRQGPGAGAPTGYSSAQQNPPADSAAATAARNVRQALDTDTTLRSADVKVSVDGDQIRLTGTVTKDDLRDRAEDMAERAAQGVDVKNELEVRQR